MAKTLIRGGYVLSMDDDIGEIAGGDVLIDGGRISDIGRALDDPEATILDASGMIVLPGFVNAHQHTWQTALRGIAGDWTLGDYMRQMHAGVATAFTPEDLYLANLVGALNQINGGTTALFDWCHNNPTPEHSDRAIDGLEESGIRALFGHGTPKPDVEEDGIPHSQRPHPADEVRRLRRGRLRKDDALVTLALAIRGPNISAYETTVHDIRLAKDFGLIASAHMGGRSTSLSEDPVAHLAKDGLLSPAFNVVHGCQLTDDDLGILADYGATVTSCPEVEMQMGHGHPVTGRLVALGAAPSLGVDIESNISGDMFTVMRMALQHQRAADNQEYLDKRESPPLVSISARSALEWATVEGARAMGLADRIGSITPGLRADLIFIRTGDLNLFPVNDPLETVVFQAGFSNVDTVMIDGNIVKRGGKLLYPHLQEKMEALAESGRRLLRDGG